MRAKPLWARVFSLCYWSEKRKQNWKMNLKRFYIEYLHHKIAWSRTVPWTTTSSQRAATHMNAMSILRRTWCNECRGNRTFREAHASKILAFCSGRGWLSFRSVFRIHPNYDPPKEEPISKLNFPCATERKEAQKWRSALIWTLCSPFFLVTRKQKNIATTARCTPATSATRFFLWLAQAYSRPRWWRWASRRQRSVEHLLSCWTESSSEHTLMSPPLTDTRPAHPAQQQQNSRKISDVRIRTDDN